MIISVHLFTRKSDMTDACVASYRHSTGVRWRLLWVRSRIHPQWREVRVKD